MIHCGPRPPSDKIVELTKLIATLTPEEHNQIVPTLNERLSQLKMQTVVGERIKLGPHDRSSTIAAKVEDKKEKTFDVKLEKFDVAAKIKVIKEVRAITNFGMKKANDLVGKAPVDGLGAGAANVEEKKEKTFDVKLEKFDAAAKIKVIKEVMAFTNLGMKEAKDLVGEGTCYTQTRGHQGGSK
ncbi:hypothetical protein V6N13_028431 [Hibiscus sabdariffa]|uniref:Large ribosomal subunit protein bL12 C-terminal domain-containing protein n=1 Tax=Hibiscus sabdariffa TaxID=183260 RepID=A0ABR2DAF3_9ROSI